MGKFLKQIVSSDFTLTLLYKLIRAYAWTFHLTVENEHIWMDHIKNGGSVVICCWHQQFFPAIRHFRNYKNLHPSLMISKSTDGKIIAGIAERSGWDIVRGSSSRNGHEALDTMITKLKQSRIAGHVVDGPRGPAGKVKPGIIRLAQACNAAIVPFYTSANKAWYFNSWDKFFIPKPFSEVKLLFGDIFPVTQSKDEKDFENQLLSLENIMRKGLIII